MHNPHLYTVRKRKGQCVACAHCALPGEVYCLRHKQAQKDARARQRRERYRLEKHSRKEGTMRGPGTEQRGKGHAHATQ